jgi:ABC-2 type transport system permease protein
MFTLLKKEIQSFLSSLIGYLVILVFLLINSLFLWVFPGSFNILDSGYASIDGLFVMAPWVFMFLIPAITMKMFADEHKTGTIELLFTKPISDLQIVLAKYLAGLILVIFSLLPTLIYYFTVHQLGQPVGNIDSGGTMGSYIGLFFLAAGYVSIGVFASSITENQIVSFIISLFLCFVCYTGFDSASVIAGNGWDHYIEALGINYHYTSMSRGVIDSRDLVYFISFATLFILSTKLILQSRKW